MEKKTKKKGKIERNGVCIWPRPLYDDGSYIQKSIKSRNIRNIQTVYAYTRGVFNNEATTIL